MVRGEGAALAAVLLVGKLVGVRGEGAAHGEGKRSCTW
jgi:hypothetical protein